MGDALDIAQAHGQHGLGTVQGLNLAYTEPSAHVNKKEEC
jgi:hypothetical protein